MAPVIKALHRAGWADAIILNTAQHRQLTDEPLALFGLKPDYDLDAMRPDQSLPDLTARLITGLSKILEQLKPDMILAQGDTTTVFCTALTAFYAGCPFGHVEAGLRTFDLANPFPEEANRALAGRLARLHFAPTVRARDNLLREGVKDDWIHLVGNTVIDSLLWMADRVEEPQSTGGRTILITAHRRESFGRPIREICRAAADLIDRFEDLTIVYPVHPNPNVTGPVQEILGGRDRVELLPPIGYDKLVAQMKRADLILTDSGGVQEEAPALGKPVLVLRETTERPEAVEAGAAKLVGPDRGRIVDQAGLLLTDAAAYRKMAVGVSPYGDGTSGRQIERILAGFFKI